MKKMLYVLLLSMVILGLSAGLSFAIWCGDGVVNQAWEQCDDGNNVDGDGCDANCQREAAPYCGDGIVQAGEECDDGNNVDGDGCEHDCTMPTGFQGCTPGYWKNHLSKWTLGPELDFDQFVGGDFFDPDITLGDAIRLRGGHVNKLGRHGTAALLNAANSNVAYPLTLDEVKAAILAGDADTLADFNELSDECPAQND